MLFDGYKFDLRLYVLVTSISPLVVHMLGDGLVRLCTTRYEEPTEENLDEKRLHLTNYSLNKNSDTFQKSKADDEGSKRSVHALLEHLAAQGVDERRVWDNIGAGTTTCDPDPDPKSGVAATGDIVCKTIIAAQPAMSASYKHFMAKQPHLAGASCTCFEIYGFDVLLDEGPNIYMKHTYLHIRMC